MKDKNRERSDVNTTNRSPLVSRASETGGKARRVRDAMTRNPSTVTQDDTLRRAAELMVECDCGAIPVVDGRRVIGIITDRDIVIRAVARGEDPQSIRVQEAMSEGIECVYEEDSVDRAFDLMSRHQIRRLPVLNANDELIGMLAQADLALDTGEEQRVGETVEEISEPRGEGRRL